MTSTHVSYLRMNDTASTNNNTFTGPRRPNAHTIAINGRRESFNKASYKQYLQNEIGRYLRGVHVRHPLTGRHLHDGRFLSILKKTATDDPDMLSEYHIEPATHYTWNETIRVAFQHEQYTRLASLLKILRSAALVEARKGRIRDRRNLDRALETLYTTRFALFSMDVPTWNLTIGRTIAENLSRRSIPQGEAYRDLLFLVRHHGIPVYQTIAQISRLSFDQSRRVGSVQQKILREGLSNLSDNLSEDALLEVSEVAFKYELKDILTHPQILRIPRISTRLVDRITSDLFFTEGEGNHIPFLSRSSESRLGFFKWFLKFFTGRIRMENENATRREITSVSMGFVLSVYASLTRHQYGLPNTREGVHVSLPLLLDYFKWMIDSAGGDPNRFFVDDGHGRVPLFVSIIEPYTPGYTVNANNRSRNYSTEDVRKIIKYFLRRGASIDKGNPSPRRLVSTIPDTSPKAWVKRTVLGITEPRLSTENRLKRNTAFHPSVNALDVVSFERVPLNQAVTLRGHEINGKIKYIFNKNTINGIVRTQTSQRPWDPTFENPFNRKRFHQGDVTPLAPRLKNMDKKMYKTLLQKKNTTNEYKHQSIENVIRHMANEEKKEKAAKKAQTKKKNNASKASGSGTKRKTTPPKSNTSKKPKRSNENGSTKRQRR